MVEQPSRRKLAAILIADAVGFSRQMGEDDELALRKLSTRTSIIRQVVVKHHGRVFGGAGDSVVAEFQSAVDALKTAIEVQEAITALNDTASELDRMQFRIGINLGDVIVERNNRFGDGVNVAERLQALAEPGGICISGNVHEQVQDKLHLDYTNLGEHKLKNIVRPVRAFLVGKAGDKAKPSQLRTGTHLSSRRSTGIFMAILVVALSLASATYFFHPWRPLDEPVQEMSGPPIIAVLPFANLSGDMKQDYFGDGFTQDIVAALGRFSNLSVLASSATAKFKGSAADSTELRQRLGARYIVTGTVRRSSDRVRISADLTDTDKNQHLWSQQFDRKLTDIFAIQDEITESIAGALAIKLSRLEQGRTLANQTERLDAYDYFLRGIALQAVGERSDYFEARAMFEKAIAIDPRYAAAIARLGETYQVEASAGWTEFVGKALERAEMLGHQALGLEPQLVEGHRLLAYVFLARGEYDRAIVEARRAVEINPSDAYSYATLGGALVWNGNANDAIVALEKARIFDPTLQWDYISPLGFAYFLAGRYDEAVAIFEPIAGSGSSHIEYAGLAAAYAELGRTAEAKHAAAEVKRLWPFFKIPNFARQWNDERSRKLIADGLTKAGLD